MVAFPGHPGQHTQTLSLKKKKKKKQKKTNKNKKKNLKLYLYIREVGRVGKLFCRPRMLSDGIFSSWVGRS